MGPGDIRSDVHEKYLIIKCNPSDGLVIMYLTDGHIQEISFDTFLYQVFQDDCLCEYDQKLEDLL